MLKLKPSKGTKRRGTVLFITTAIIDKLIRL